MLKYLKRKQSDETSSKEKPNVELCSKDAAKKSCLDFELPELPSDPGKRPKITDYDPNIRERVRRNYYLKGSFQPKELVFPQRDIKRTLRRFNPAWYTDFKWLEYNIEKDAAFCLYCYLFKNELGHQGGGDAFVSEGFRDWKTKEKLRKHEGKGHNSAHKTALRKCQDLLNQKQHIETTLARSSEQSRIDYSIRLNAAIDCTRWLLKQGLPFRGNKESNESFNQGNYLELLKFHAHHDKEVDRVSLDNAPGNDKLICPRIQKDIIRACAFETTNVIIKELADSPFSILLDESRDVSVKEQVEVVLRFVDRKGCVVERLLGFQHVSSTTVVSLKSALVDLLAAHGLSLSSIRGQGYDGASNMKGDINGLKTLILNENQYAYYIYCFAHQLQLALVAVAKNHINIALLFYVLCNIVNVVGGSCKRHDALREKQASKIVQALENEEIIKGQGLNQESTLVRPSDTRWGSHYKTLLNLIQMFSSTIDVLDEIMEDGSHSDQRAEAMRLVNDMQSFEFVFNLHLMRAILGITNDLSLALQRKDQDIGQAMMLVGICKIRLQGIRDDAFSSLLEEVYEFCVKFEISVPNMDDYYVGERRSRRRAEKVKVTNSHHYHVELFNTVIDMQLQELNFRFNEVNTELLLCIACLHPSDSFASFDKKRLVKLAQFYPNDFSSIELSELPDQLENFIMDIRVDIDASELKGIDDISQKMVQTRKNVAYPLVYQLLTLTFILPVATATVERAFSAMKIVKNHLRNRMGDEYLNDCLITYVEKDVFCSLSNEVIINYFQNMSSRRGQL